MRTGCQWRDLPTDFGPWKSVYTRFRRWCLSGFWEFVWARAMDQAVPCCSGLRHLDSSQIKAHKHAQVGPEPLEGRKIGKTKGGPNTKLNAITDSRRRPIALSLTEGQSSEYVGALELLKSCEGMTIVADKGYDSDPFRYLIGDWGNDSCIAPRKNRVKPVEFSKTIYKKRHNVENYFCWTKESRAISTRYDQTPVSFMGFVILSATILWLLSPF